MSKKEEKKRMNRQKALKFVIAPYIFGIAMLILGIVGLLGNNSDYREYQNSDDVRTVDAEVTYAEIKETAKLSYEQRQYAWDVQLRFTVDGQEYTGKERLYSEAKKGDTIRIEVYRAKNGEYKIPLHKSDTGKGFSNILMYAAIGVGALVTAASTFYLVDELRKNKKR